MNNTLIHQRTAIAAVALCVAVLPGVGDARAEDFCTPTADALLDACWTSVRADGALGSAVCINITNPSARNGCLDDLAESQDEDNQLCLDQYETRLVACRALGEGRYDPDIRPSRFDDPKRPSKPNPYFPLGVGKHWEYRSTSERNTVDVVSETKLIAGVTCIVVRDLVYEDGVIHEATDDWYASAKDGSVWYFGEEVKNYETFEGDKPPRPELVSIEGSFKVGRDGDKPGVIALAAPAAGNVYVEEFSLGTAEDVTEILSTTYAYGQDRALDENVPRGLVQRFCAGNCIVTKNYSLLEPGLFARKYYARGVGTILEVENTGEVVQLVGCNFDSRCRNLPLP